MARIVIIPGLAVRGYAKPPSRALIRRGHRVSLLAAPTWRGTRTNLTEYGRMLAAQLDRAHDDVDLLIGLSVGTQAAVEAAAGSARVGRVLLISPTVDPAHRSVSGLIGRWLHGDPDDEGPGWTQSLPDWSRAGIGRIAAGYLSALRTPIERALPRVSAEVTVMRAEHDSLSTESWVRSLAVDDEHFRVIPDGSHSWPVGADEEFADLVGELLA